MKAVITSSATAISAISASTSDHGSRHWPGPELSIVVPVLNERGNLIPLIEKVTTALEGQAFEIVFVDDASADGTSELLLLLANKDSRIRRVRRIGRRGLTSACFEGILSTTSQFIAIMDGDLQHDPALLRDMRRCLSLDEADIVVASRYVATGSVGKLSPHRRMISGLATSIGRRFLACEISDPMSGFFMARRELAEVAATKSSGFGFKILFEIIKANSGSNVRLREMGYEFQRRRYGDSKLDLRSLHDFFLMLLHHVVGRWLPPRFIMFCFIGAFGVLVHFAVLSLLLPLISFTTAHTSAGFVAMTFNYAINNELTFRDKRLRALRWFHGWLWFCAICSIGLMANVGIATVLFTENVVWYFSAMAGILVGSVWNFAMTSIYTWQTQRF